MRTQKRSSYLKIVVFIVIVALAAYVVKTHWHVVYSGLVTALHAQPGWLLLAILGTIGTFLLAAQIYGVLAFKPLRYRQTVLIEIAGAFVNRLLPAGLGGLGLHGDYLYRRKHTAAQAGVVVSVNNIIGIIAHLLLLLIVSIVCPNTFREFARHEHIHISVSVLVFILLAVVIASLLLKSRIVHAIKAILKSVRQLSVHTLVRALSLAMLLTLTYTFILYAGAHAVHVQLSYVQTFIAFSIGMLASTITPTPGGLVGAEAGLYTGLTGFGVADSLAGATVVLYRLTTYWLPLIPGGIALLIARKRNLV